MSLVARASAVVLATLVTLTVYVAPAYADLCADAKALGKRGKGTINPSSADFIVLAEAFRACRDLRNASGIPYDAETEYISAQIANSYKAALETIQAEVTPLIQKAAQRGEERDEALSKLKTAQERVAELEARPPPEPVERPPELEYQRFAFRIETGFSAGRVTRVGSQGKFSHSGGFIQLSLLPRFPFRGGRHAVLVGPYYSFWGAVDRTSDVNIVSAGVHGFGAKLEFDLGIWQKIDRWVTLHPSIEMGLDYVHYASQPDGNLNPYSGFVFAGNLNICVWDAVGCLGLRLKSVPGEVAVPTTQVALGFDPIRLVAALKRRKALSKR